MRRNGRDRYANRKREVGYFPEKVLNFARVVFMVDFFPREMRKYRRWIVWCIWRRGNKCEKRAENRERGRVENS